MALFLFYRARGESASAPLPVAATSPAKTKQRPFPPNQKQNQNQHPHQQQQQTDGGYPTAYAYGQAIANAEPGSDNWRALVAATASVFCTSADSANAWSAAVAVAVEVEGNKNGCQLLTDAYAAAVQQCGQGLFTILDGVDQTTARVLQNCGLIDGPLPNSYGGGRR